MEKFYANENLFGDLNDNPGDYLKDQVLFDELYKNYKSSLRISLIFNFTVTIQNHGPYFIYENETKYIKDDGSLEDEVFNSVNNYFHGIKSTSEELAKFLAEI